MNKDKICATCKYNEYCPPSMYCGNEDSPNYEEQTFYNDSCDSWEAKEKCNNRNRAEDESSGRQALQG